LLRAARWAVRWVCQPTYAFRVFFAPSGAVGAGPMAASVGSRACLPSPAARARWTIEATTTKPQRQPGPSANVKLLGCLPLSPSLLVRPPVLCSSVAAEDHWLRTGLRCGLEPSVSHSLLSGIAATLVVMLALVRSTSLRRLMLTGVPCEYYLGHAVSRHGASTL
jgi:hypothetical protein